jgi:hypothetical protein
MSIYWFGSGRLMELSEKVRRVMEGESISEEELAFMLDSAAITRLSGCNRRYHHWLMKVKDDVYVEDMIFASVIELGVGEQKVLEDHEPCNGRGCHECGWRGEIIRYISDKSLPKHEPLKTVGGNETFAMDQVPPKKRNPGNSRGKRS